jgi:hypothetical protein
MAFQTERIQIDGSLNVDGSIFQYQVPFVGGGGGGGGDVAWADGNVGSNNYMITAAGDGSIVAESTLTFGSTILQPVAGSGTNLTIQAGEHTSGGTGGAFYLKGGLTNGATGGAAYLRGGIGSGAGGNVYIDGGTPNPDGTGGDIYIRGGNGGLGTDGKIYIGTQDTSTIFIGSDGITVNTNGYVGIGVGGPANPLYVYNATVNSVARFESGDRFGIIEVKDPNSTWSILVDGTDQLLRFTTAASGGGDSVLTLKENQRVGVNNISPSYALDVTGKTRSTDGFQTGNYEMVYNSTADSLDFNYIG